MTIKVRQYFRPNGRSEEATTEVSDDLAPQYQLMQEKGWNISGEVLPTGEVCLCIEDRPGEEDICCFIVPNGPKVQETIEKMLRERVK